MPKTVGVPRDRQLTMVLTFDDEDAGGRGCSRVHLVLLGLRMLDLGLVIRSVRHSVRARLRIAVTEPSPQHGAEVLRADRPGHRRVEDPGSWILRGSPRISISMRLLSEVQQPVPSIPE